MANPKRKNSKARTRKRRSTYYNRLSAPTTMECPNCSETKLLHRHAQTAAIIGVALWSKGKTQDDTSIRTGAIHPDRVITTFGQEEDRIIG